MKNKIVLLMIGILLAIAQQGKAQSKARQHVLEIAAKKAEREKRLMQLHLKINEQKGQLQQEKKTERNVEWLPPVQQEKGRGLGLNVSSGNTNAATSKRAGGKNETASE